MPLYRDRWFWGLLGLTLASQTAYGWWASQHWADHPWLSHAVVDVWTWGDFFRNCQAGLIPYVHFTREYPVGAGLLYWLMSPLVNPDNGSHTLRVHALVMGVFDLANTALVYALARTVHPGRAPWLTALYVLAPTHLLLSPLRFEAAVMTPVLLGAWCHDRGRPGAAALFWSAGASLKWFPALFLAAREVQALALGQRRQWLRSLALFAGITTALNLPFVLLAQLETGSLGPWWESHAFHLKRPLFWDTVLGVWGLWFGTPPAERYASYWTLGLVAAALVVRPRLRLECRFCLLCAAMLMLNRIYSPQFHLWFYPFLVLVLARQRGTDFPFLLGLAGLLELTNLVVYPFGFAGALGELGSFGSMAARLRGGPWTLVFSLAVVLRAALLAGLAAFLLGGPRRELRDG